MTKSRQRFHILLSLFLLLCAVSFDHLSPDVLAADGAYAGLNSGQPAVKADSASLMDLLSQEIRNAIEVIRPCLVTIRTTGRQSVLPLTPLLPEFSDDYSLLDSNHDLPSFLRSNSDSTSLGTGVIVSEEGLIWTSSDVIKNCESVMVTLQNGRSHEGRVVLNNADTGLAIIKIDARKLPSVHFARRAKPGIADWAIAVAIDDCHEPIISAGFVSSVSRGYSEPSAGTKTIRFSFPVPDDCSGCAFINLKGELLGIHVPGLPWIRGSTCSCVALDAESAMALQRRVLEDPSASDSQSDHSAPDNNVSKTAETLGHDTKEDTVLTLNFIREMLSVSPSEWRTAEFSSSVRTWLTSWQDARRPQARPNSKSSELR